MENVGGAFGFMSIIMIIGAVFLFLLPFFVFKIRNQVIEMNKKMSQIIKLLGGQAGDPLYKTCPSCQAKNRIKDINCVSCGGPLL